MTAAESEKTVKVEPRYWSLGGGQYVMIKRGDILRRPEYPSLLWGKGILMVKTGDSDSPSDMEPVLNDGKPINVTACQLSGTSSTGLPFAKTELLYKGTICVTHTGLLQTVDASGTLSFDTGKQQVTIEATNGLTGEVSSHTTTARNLREQKNADWLEPLGLAYVQSPTQLGKYIRCLALNHEEMFGRVRLIGGQGSVKMPDGNSVLATIGGVYDQDGRRLSKFGTGLKFVLQDHTLVHMHDILPENEYTAEEVVAGLILLNKLLGLSNTYPEIPAAHVGQLITSTLASYAKKKFAVCTWLHAVKGTGKTEFMLLFSRIQASPKLRAENIEPEINLGADAHNTARGPKYLFEVLSLGAPLIDDVIKKSGMSQADRQKNISIYDSAVRSLMSGPGVQGNFDKTTGVSGPIRKGIVRTSLRATAEEAPPTDSDGVTSSLYDRIIVQGGWPEMTDGRKTEYSDIFDANTSAELRTDESVRLMHIAYSAISLWTWRNIMRMRELRSKAEEITSNWNVPSRTKTIYTVPVCGLLALHEFATEYDIDLPVENAIKALEQGAIKQADSTHNVDLMQEFLKELRLAMRQGVIAATHRPESPNSTVKAAHITACIIETTNEDDPNIHEETFIWPENVTPADLGLTRGAEKETGAYHRPKKRDAIEMWLMPPRDNKKGGRPGKYLYADEWTIAFDSGTLALVARELTKRRFHVDGLTFDAVILSGLLRTAGYNDRTRIHVIPDCNIGTIDNSMEKKSIFRIPVNEIFSENEEAE